MPSDSSITVSPNPFVPLSEPVLAGNEWKYVKECLDTGWVSSVGPFVDRFEREFAAYTGAPLAVATVNGTAALHTALLAVGVKPDDEVIVSDLTFVAPVNAIRYCGANPVFMDVAPETWQMDVSKLEVFGGQFWRPYLHVRDAARMMQRVLESPVATVGGQVFNVGDSTQNFQKQQLVELIRAEVGPDVEIEYVHRNEDPRDYRVAFDKVAGTGFRITRTVPDGIREVMGAIKSGVITDFTNPKYRD